VYFKEDVSSLPHLKNIENFLISKYNRDLFRDGDYPTGVFTGQQSILEIVRTNISNVVTEMGLFKVSDY
jgi:hypothetical protein